MTAPLQRSPVATAGTQWRILTASARGASHVAKGLPNQDAVAHLLAGESPGPTMVAVADGHGHRRHFRSATGSHLAVRASVVAARAFVSGVTGLTTVVDVESAVRSVLLPDILE